MNSFILNHELWQVKRVKSTSKTLIDRTGRYRIATTDPHTHCIYISNKITGKFRDTVLMHELGHCVMFSYGLIDDIHSFVHPDNWIYAEEWVCNFIAHYGQKVMSTAKKASDYYDEDDIWEMIPHFLEKLLYLRW